MEWKWIEFYGYKLRAPKGFLDSDLVTSGRCGPGSGWKEKIVPEKILGLSITPSCKIHDFIYRTGTTEEEKTNGDIELFANGYRIIKQYGGWLSLPRAMILSVYFLAVAYGGEAAYNKET